MESITNRPTLHVQDDEPLPEGLLLIADEPAPLSVQLLADGWQRGLPAQVSVATFALDAHTYARQRCPECGRRKLVAEPFHKDGQYKIVLACRCGAETEV